MGEPTDSNGTGKEVGGGRYDEELVKPTVYDEIRAEQEVSDLPTKIEKSDIYANPGSAGTTEIVLQRHGAYVRDREDPKVGSLSPESAAVERAAATKYFEDYIQRIPENERDKVNILIVASDTQYFEGGRRSQETASIAQSAAEEVLGRYGLSKDQIINNTGRMSGDGGPRTMPKLREPNFLNDSPEYLEYMLGQYGGINLDFWTAFESDTHSELREQMGAEGPDDIADRTAQSVRVLARYAQAYHKSNPGQRLVIWGATHYDTISPFVKREVFGVPKDNQLLVDYGAGITIDIDAEGKGTTKLGDKSYVVPLERVKK